MLASLWIEGLALVDSLSLQFEPGFTVLTGETGAGKSVIVGALELALGGRADMSQIADGRDSASVTAEFVVPQTGPLAEALAELDVRADDGRLVLARRLSRTSGSACRCNGQPATVSMLRAIGDLLAELHGQHEHQDLLRPARHLDLVDAFGGAELRSTRDAYADLYRAYQEAREARDALARGDALAAKRSELLRHQLAEIDGASLRVGEEDELIAQRAVLANAARLAEGAAKAVGLLSSDDGPARAEDLVASAARELSNLGMLDPSLAPLARDLEGALIGIHEVVRSLAEYAHGLEADPARLEAIEERLALIRDLRRKYGPDVTDVIHYRAMAAEELASLDRATEALASAAASVDTLEADVRAVGSRLSALRAKAGERLAREVTAKLRALGMSAGILTVDHSIEADIARWTSRGRDHVQFMAVTSKGQPPMPLAKIASGGETSRTMLAIRAVAALEDAVPTVVFDEIDVGIGGTTLARVGHELLALAEGPPGCQVICITHAPQIAALAHHHIAVRKRETAGRSTIEADPVEGQDREEELVRMLGADSLDGAAARHAEELARLGAKAREG